MVRGPWDSRLGVIREAKRVKKGAKRSFEEAVNVDCLKNRFLIDVSDEITTFRGHRNPKTDLKSSRTSILRPHNSNLNFNNEKRELKTVNNEIIAQPMVRGPPPLLWSLFGASTRCRRGSDQVLIRSRKRFTEKVEF